MFFKFFIILEGIMNFKTLINHSNYVVYEDKTLLSQGPIIVKRIAQSFIQWP